MPRQPARSAHRLGIAAFPLALFALALLAASAPAQTAYVTNLSADTVTPFDTETGLVGTAIPVGETPRAVAVTPDGATAYVVNTESDDVTPIDTATGVPGAAIEVGETPTALAIAPDGQTVYVTGIGSDDVTPIDVASGAAGAPIEVGDGPSGIAITPDGSTAYVSDIFSDDLTPIDLATAAAGEPIEVGDSPSGIAIAPDGETAYVANVGDDTVSPVDTATGVAGTPVEVGDGPQEIAITPNGAKAYVLDIIANEVTPIDLTTGTVQANIVTGAAPFAVAVAPDGSTLYITNAESSTVTPVDTATDVVGDPVEIDVAAGIALVPYQAPAATFSALSDVAGGEARFDASESSELGGSGATYSWDFGDGSGATTTSPLISHSYPSPGNYTATLTVTNAGGCSTDFVFTGQTAACNGGPSALARLTLPIYPRIAGPTVSARQCRSDPAVGWGSTNRPRRPISGVRAAIQVDPAETTMVTANLSFRRHDRVHRVDLGRLAVGRSGQIATPLPAALRRSLGPGAAVRLLLTIGRQRGCDPQRISHRSIRTSVVTLMSPAAAGSGG